MTSMPKLTEPSILDDYLRQIGETPLLSADEELRLARLMRNGDAAARDQFIRANLRLVVSIAKKHTGRGLALPDLIGYGNEGLLKAAKKYNPERGHKFSTMATWWIRQTITRAICDYGRAIRLPVHLVERRARIRAWLAQVEGTTAHAPTPADIGLVLELSEHQVIQALHPADASHSLNYLLTEDDNDGRELGETIPAPAEDFDEHINHDELRQHLLAALRLVPKRHAAVLAVRYGLLDGEQRTLDATGRIFSVTRERARQLEKEAILSLRERAPELRQFLETAA